MTGAIVGWFLKRALRNSFYTLFACIRAHIYVTHFEMGFLSATALVVGALTCLSSSKFFG
jgi:small-conductance mechanosensitive channel